MQGIATSPINPILKSKIIAKAKAIEIVERFIKTVETKEVAKLLTNLESTPTAVAIFPPLFSLSSKKLTGNLKSL